MLPATRAFFDSQWPDVCDALQTQFALGYPPHDLLVLILDSGRRVDAEPKPLIAVFHRSELATIEAADRVFVEADLKSRDLSVTVTDTPLPETTLVGRTVRHLLSIEPDCDSLPVQLGKVVYVVQTDDEVVSGAIGPKPN